MRQCLAQPCRPEELFAVILRAPFVFGRFTFHDDRRPAHGARGGESLVQRGAEDEGFDARTGLALGLGHAVEAALVKIESAGECQHRAVGGTQRHERAADLRNPGESPRSDLLLQRRVFNRLEVNDIPGVQHVRGLLGRRPQGVFIDVGTGPRQPRPADFGDGAVLGVDLRAFLVDLEHDARKQVAHDPVILEHVVEMFLVRLAADRYVTGGPAVTMTVLILEQSVAQGLDRGLLVIGVDRGVDMKSAGVGLFVISLDHVLAHHLGHVRCLDIKLVGMLAGGERRVDRLGVCRLVDEAKILHLAQDGIAPFDGVVGIGQGVVARRRLRKPGEHRHFRERQFLERFPVINLRRGGEAVGAMAEKYLVEVELENLFFAQFAFDLERQQDFLDFARIGFFGAEKEVARHLHGNGAGALSRALGAQVVQGSAQDAGEVHAVVIEEGTVLGREHRLDEQIRHLVDAHGNAFFLAELGDQLTVGRVDPHRHFQLRPRKVVERGQGRCQDESDQREHHHAAGEQPEQSDQSQLPAFGGQMLAGPAGEKTPRIIHRVWARLMELVRESRISVRRPV